MILDILKGNQDSIKIAHFHKMNFSHFHLRILKICRTARMHRSRKQPFQMLDHNGHIKHKVDLDHLHPGLDNRSQMTEEIMLLDLDWEKQTRKIDFLHSNRKPSQVWRLLIEARVARRKIRKIDHFTTAEWRD